ncbi:MAG TPA: hypothetical protein PLP29_16300 [Candidatus Ozemobacteraceae bacterium]|nr:hypothetical protein [Candidatus Ozemobacteraceae bacterium]
MNPSSIPNGLARALDAIAGVDAVPHCLLPMLARQTLFVASPAGKRESELLLVFTAPGRPDLPWREVSVREVVACVGREGLSGFVIDPESPRRLPVRGSDLAALKLELEKAAASGNGAEMVECGSGAELVFATPEPVPSAAFVAALAASLRQGGSYRKAWLFDLVLPGGSEGELCLGIVPDGATDAAALEAQANAAFQSASADLPGRRSLAFLVLDEADLAEVVAGVGIPVEDGVAG